MALDLVHLGEQAKREQQLLNRMLFDIERTTFSNMVAMSDTIDHDTMQQVAQLAVQTAPYLLAAKGFIPPITRPDDGVDKN